MTHSTFDRYINWFWTTHILRTLNAKSEEYSTENDKLHNFKRAGKIDNITSERALWGMDLKHRTSIADMVDELDNEIYCTIDKWVEKITDHINYCLLLLALVYELYYGTQVDEMFSEHTESSSDTVTV